MKKHTLITLATVAALGAGAGFWYWNGTPANRGSTAKVSPPVPVLLAQATVQDMPVVLEAVGRAEAYETVTVKSRVDGQVASLTFTEGQHIKQGDELLRLDSTDFALRLRQAEANLARDEAQLAKARADTLRYTSLRERNFVSEEKLNDIRTAEAGIAASLSADRAALELARAQLSYTILRAPFSGVVGAKLVFPGGAVKANDTGLAVINRVLPLYVTFSISEKHLPRLRSALPPGHAPCNKANCPRVGVTLPGDKNQRHEGSIRFIDNAVDAATGTLQIKAVLDNKDEALTPGQFLNVSLNLDTLRDAIVVPSEAVQQGPEGAFIFVVHAQGAAEVRKIEVGNSHAGLTQIVKGLAAGETVVTDGQLRLTPGASVVDKKAASRAETPPARQP